MGHHWKEVAGRNNKEAEEKKKKNNRWGFGETSGSDISSSILC